MYHRIIPRLAHWAGVACLTFVLPALTACGGDDGAEGGSVEAFCAIARRMEESDSVDPLLSGDASLDDVEAVWTKLVKDSKDLATAAPDEIADEAAVVANLYMATVDVLADNDYDVTRAFSSGGLVAAVPEWGSGRTLAASEALEDYLATECGITPRS
jgi:hypothetical protein